MPQSKENTTISIKTIEEILTERYPTRSGEMKDLTMEEYLAKFRQETTKDIPPRFKGADLSDDKIKQFLKDFDWEKGAYIYGACGSGKTHNLYGMYNTLRANRYFFGKKKEEDDKPDLPNVQITTVIDFLSDLKTTYSGENSEEKITRKIHTDDILFLDDFGTEKMSEWTEEVTYRLINHRYEYLKPTFFSSNLSIAEIADKVGDRIASRIVHMCEVIKLEGEDRRLKS